MIAVSVRNLGKRYKLYRRPEYRLLEALCPWLRLHRELWALRGINFELRQGESLAVIGPNGAGKSTLLRILAGASVPTEGSVEIRGRVGAVLELGLGFAATLTGRQNIRLTALMMGLSPEEVDERIDEIAAFSELGEYLDRPIREYSSGMRSRLGFAIASHLDVQVLLADEALSAGDHVFRMRAAERTRQLLERGVTLVYATHSARRAMELCQRAIWIEYGRIMEDGPVADVIRSYNTRSKNIVLASGSDRPELPRATILAVRVVGIDGRPFAHLSPSVWFRCEVDLYCNRAIEDLDLAVACSGQADSAARSLRLSRFHPQGVRLEAGFHRVSVRLKAPRAAGVYDVVCRLGRSRAVFGERFYETRVLPGALVVSEPETPAQRELPEAEWEHRKLEPAELAQTVPSELDLRQPSARAWLRSGWCFGRNRIGPVGPAELFLFVPATARRIELAAGRLPANVWFTLEDERRTARCELRPRGRRGGVQLFSSPVPEPWKGRALLLVLSPVRSPREPLRLPPGREPVVHWIRAHAGAACQQSAA